MLQCASSVQLHPKRSSFELNVKSALSGFLALVLCFSALVSVTHGLHRLANKANGDDGHVCLICSLIKGQISAADVTTITTALVLSFVFAIRLLTAGFLSSEQHRLSPSRAPPRS